MLIQRRNNRDRLMADRKQFIDTYTLSDDLKALIERSKRTPVTEEQLREQRVSFAFGNCPDSEFITKESVRKASKTIRLAS